jgi:hypothetical protein
MNGAGGCFGMAYDIGHGLLDNPITGYFHGSGKRWQWFWCLQGERDAAGLVLGELLTQCSKQS